MQPIVYEKINVAIKAIKSSMIIYPNQFEDFRIEYYGQIEFLRAESSEKTFNYWQALFCVRARKGIAEDNLVNGVDFSINDPKLKEYFAKIVDNNEQHLSIVEKSSSTHLSNDFILNDLFVIYCHGNKKLSIEAIDTFYQELYYFVKSDLANDTFRLVTFNDFQLSFVNHKG